MTGLTESLKRLKDGQRLSIIGPFGTQVAERLARDEVEQTQRTAGVMRLKYLGPGCSALLTPEGQAYLRQIAGDYLQSVPTDHPVVAVTPSFRLPKQVLEVAGSVRGVSPQLPRLGLELCLDSIQVIREAMQTSGRSLSNTLLTMSVGPPFECYKPELTPPDIDNKYLPQVFAAIRCGYPLDYLMFETVSSLSAAVGAAAAFTKAHRRLNLEKSKADFRNSGTITYIEDLIEKAAYMGPEAIHRLAPSYDPSTKTFEEIEREKEYVISLCLDEHGKFYCNYPNLSGPQTLPDPTCPQPLEYALNVLRGAIEAKGLYPPAGISINCNSPAVTRRALEQLRSDGQSTFGGLASSERPHNSDWIIGIHPNASSEDNPRMYEQMTTQQAIPRDEFTALVTGMANEFGLRIIGGCCGTDHHTMRQLYEAQKTR